VTAMMRERRFGEAGDRVLIEEYLEGAELSYFVLSDGERVVPLGSAQDHKRVYDGDAGPNTGGMGAFAPSPRCDAALERRILDEIVDPVIAGMRVEGHPYRGFLYCGLMLTPSGPRVIEFNVRFGDPEAQVVLPLLRDPLTRHLKVAATSVTDVAAGFSPRIPVPGGVAVGVVLAAHGYPGDVRTGDVIHGLDDVASDCPDVQLRFAGVKQQGDQLVTAGGRVLTVVATASSFEIAIARAYEAASKISFDGMQYRKDIGQRALTGERKKGS
jgi:phosphoribosylamine---glycine ligase